MPLAQRHWSRLLTHHGQLAIAPLVMHVNLLWEGLATRDYQLRLIYPACRLVSRARLLPFLRSEPEGPAGESLARETRLRADKLWTWVSGRLGTRLMMARFSERILLFFFQVLFSTLFFFFQLFTILRHPFTVFKRKSRSSEIIYIIIIFHWYYTFIIIYMYNLYQWKCDVMYYLILLQFQWGIEYFFILMDTQGAQILTWLSKL